MKLFLLKRHKDARWGETQGYVVRAADEQDARRLATEQSLEPIGEPLSFEVEIKPSAVESKDYDEKYTMDDVQYSPWEDPIASTCEELVCDGAREVIMQDYMEP